MRGRVKVEETMHRVRKINTIFAYVGGEKVN
jgi:hypothetical protein